MGTVEPSSLNSTPINQYVVTSQTLQNAQTGSANGTVYDITGMATVQVLISPTAWTGTVTFEASIDGTTFVNIKGNQMDTQNYADNVANPGSTSSIWTFQTAGLTKFRAVTSNAGGTSVTVTAKASPYPCALPFGVNMFSASTVLNTTQTGISASGNSGDISVGSYRELVLDVNLTALTGTSVAFILERKDAAGNYVAIYSPAALTGVSTIAQTIGVGAETNKGFGDTIRLRWVCTAVSTTTFTASIKAK